MTSLYACMSHKGQSPNLVFKAIYIYINFVCGSKHRLINVMSMDGHAHKHIMNLIKFIFIQSASQAYIHTMFILI